MARPTKMTEEKIRQLKAICRLKPTLEDCAAYLDLNPSTIEKWIKKNEGVRFSEFRNTYMVHTRFSTVRALMKSIDSGNIKAIELGLKYFCKWSESSNVEHQGDIHIKIDADDAKL